jgi:hypothetical protein
MRWVAIYRFIPNYVPVSSYYAHCGIMRIEMSINEYFCKKDYTYKYACSLMLSDFLY